MVTFDVHVVLHVEGTCDTIICVDFPLILHTSSAPLGVQKIMHAPLPTMQKSRSTVRSWD